jgi:hypothetical protein
MDWEKAEQMSRKSTGFNFFLGKKTNLELGGDIIFGNFITNNVHSKLSDTFKRETPFFSQNEVGQTL